MHPFPTVEVRRAADRTTTTAPGVVTRHSFSFGSHYDPTNTGHGLLVAHNDELVAAGHGFGPHPHRDVEIVTWVVSGRLRHEDERGSRRVVEAGSVQVLSAGTGVRHAERNDTESGPDVRFVQMWLRPSMPGTAPRYAAAPAPPGRWVRLATSRPGEPVDPAAGPALPLGCPATLHLARLAAGEGVDLPEAPSSHLFVLSGRVGVAGEQLAPADAVRITAPGPHPPLRLAASAEGAAEVLVWEMHAGASGTMEG